MLTQILINSVHSAMLLALVALGFNIIFSTTRVFHLAHGAIFVAGVYAFSVSYSYVVEVMSSGPASAVASLCFAVLVTCSLSVVIEYLVYQPLFKSRASSLISLISSLGVYLFVTNFLAFIFGNETLSLNSKSEIFLSNPWFILTTVEFTNITLSLCLIIGFIFFTRTSYYRAIRAVGDSESVAEKFGIDVKRTRLLVLIVGSFLACVAGIMRASDVAIDPHVGLPITLSASVAVIVGGVRSPLGTLIACFIIALLQNFSVKFVSAEWKDGLTYGLLILVLVFYQQGLISVKRRIEAT